MDEVVFEESLHTHNMAPDSSVVEHVVGEVDGYLVHIKALHSDDHDNVSKLWFVVNAWTLPEHGFLVGQVYALNDALEFAMTREQHAPSPVTFCGDFTWRRTPIQFGADKQAHKFDPGGYAPESNEEVVSQVAEKNQLDALPSIELVDSVFRHNNALVDIVPVEPAKTVILMADDSDARVGLCESELGRESSPFSKQRGEQHRLWSHASNKQSLHWTKFLVDKVTSDKRKLGRRWKYLEAMEEYKSADGGQFTRWAEGIHIFDPGAGAFESDDSRAGENSSRLQRRPQFQRTNLGNVGLTLTSLSVDNLLHFDFMDPPPAAALVKALELPHALGALNKKGELTRIGEVMSEFPLALMLSKMIVASENYGCCDEIISIACMLSVGNSIFCRPMGKELLADYARRSFHVGDVGDHIALLNVYNSWKDNKFSAQWCYENYVHGRSMGRAGDISDQLERLVARAGIPLLTNVNDLDAIKKAIASGFFPHSARLRKHGDGYVTMEHTQNACIHPSSGLAGVCPRWVIYHEWVLTTKEFMRQVTQLKPDWLLEVAPHYYKVEEVVELDSFWFMNRMRVQPSSQSDVNENEEDDMLPEILRFFIASLTSTLRAMWILTAGELIGTRTWTLPTALQSAANQAHRTPQDDVASSPKPKRPTKTWPDIF